MNTRILTDRKTNKRSTWKVIAMRRFALLAITSALTACEVSDQFNFDFDLNGKSKKSDIAGSDSTLEANKPKPPAELLAGPQPQPKAAVDPNAPKPGSPEHMFPERTQQSADAVRADVAAFAERLETLLDDPNANPNIANTPPTPSPGAPAEPTPPPTINVTPVQPGTPVQPVAPVAPVEQLVRSPADPTQALQEALNTDAPVATIPTPEVPKPGEEPATNEPVLKPVQVAESRPAMSREELRQSLKAEELIGELKDRMDRELGRSPNGLRPWIARAALSTIDPRVILEEEDFATLAPGGRKIVQAYQQLFRQLGRDLTMNDLSADVVLLKAASESLDKRVSDTENMRLLNPRLCWKVDGYGIYKLFKKHVFMARQRQAVIVYSEIERFNTMKDGDGNYNAGFRWEIVIYNESDGLAVWRAPAQDITDQSRNRRRDFFITDMMYIPEELGVGRYLLKLTVTDRNGGAFDEVTMPFQLVADPKLVRFNREE